MKNIIVIITEFDVESILMAQIINDTYLSIQIICKLDIYWQSDRGWPADYYCYIEIPNGTFLARSDTRPSLRLILTNGKQMENLW